MPNILRRDHTDVAEWLKDKPFIQEIRKATYYFQTYFSPNIFYFLPAYFFSTVWLDLGNKTTLI